jgi:hypothetical protein
MDQRTSRDAIGDSRGSTAKKGEQFFQTCTQILEQICNHIINDSIYDPE